MQVELANAIDVHIPLTISKVNKETREVEGILSQEIKDVQGHVVDHESMKAVLADWPGNIREMHQPIAVGKAVKVISDDDNKCTILRARISKGAPDTWEKVLDGTLSMYSIGGKGVLKAVKTAAGDDEQRLFMTKLVESSLVDNGACPTAKFEIVKSVDGQSVECQPAELPDPDIAETQTSVHVLRTAGGMREVLARLLPILTTEKVAKALQVHEVASVAVAKLEALPAEQVEKSSYPTPYMIERTLGAIATLESILADEWWKLLDKASYDPESDHAADRAQVQVLRGAIELVLAYLASEFNAQFADMDAEAAGPEVAMSRSAELVKQAAFALPVVFGKLTGTGELWIAKAGARHSKSDVQMIQAMHDTAMTLGASCKAADCEQCKTAAVKAAATPPAEPTEKAVPAGQAPAQEATTPPAEGQEGVAAATAPATPAAAPETPIAQAAGLTADVQTLVKAAVAEAVAVQKATSDAAIAELRTQVEKLSNEPVPGGPKARATTEGTPVHKSIGNGAAADLSAVDPLQLEAFAAQLAAEAKTEEEKLRIVTNLLKFQHATGAGAVAIQQTTGRPRAIEAAAGTSGQ